MNKYTEEEIAKLQRNLSLIRNAGGWTMQQFGDMIGVTKQTICNLEKDFKDTPTMSLTQYLAIRTVLDYEIKEHPNNELLKSTVNLCLNTDKISKNDSDKMKAFVSGAKKSGLDEEAIIAGVAALLGITVAALISPTAITTAGNWVAKLLFDRK